MHPFQTESISQAHLTTSMLWKNHNKPTLSIQKQILEEKTSISLYTFKINNFLWSASWPSISTCGFQFITLTRDFALALKQPGTQDLIVYSSHWSSQGHSVIIYTDIYLDIGHFKAFKKTLALIHVIYHLMVFKEYITNQSKQTINAFSTERLCCDLIAINNVIAVSCETRVKLWRGSFEVGNMA
jgi:hypothetical protein